uniref:Na+-translocating membrane potential-generating system MpsC domain-containing protein n=1 Tax=Panagrolaimus sp. PS1159 TaxID=55785 RepID=A0AC35GF67_9BILA
MTKRHNAIVDRLVDGFNKRKGKTEEIQLEKIISTTASTDAGIVIIDKKETEAIIIDVTCPYENLPQAFVNACERKIVKYESIKQELRDQGYNVFVGAFNIGSLGGYNREFYVFKTVTKFF